MRCAPTTASPPATTASANIASWSKDKTLPELRESLEVISKTADGLINDIDRHYAEILKEREAELIAAEPAMAMERLYAVDDRYLHVQRTDTGVDYTIYDKASMKEIDGGQLDMEISTLAESRLKSATPMESGRTPRFRLRISGYWMNCRPRRMQRLPSSRLCRRTRSRKRIFRLTRQFPWRHGMPTAIRMMRCSR